MPEKELEHDISSAVARLNRQLPLKQRQDSLGKQQKAMHQWILRFLVKQGRAPRAHELRHNFGDEGLHDISILVRHDLVVTKGTDILGAYPVTTEQTPHRLTVFDHVIYAMCALDALSVAPLFSTRVVIESVCRVSARPIMIRMDADRLVEIKPSDNIVVGIRWRMPIGTAAHSMCLEMVFLKDRQTAGRWLNESRDNTSLFSLQEAVDFGKEFFLPLLNQ